MVLPLVDEDRPKCHLCHRGFRDIAELREHRDAAHGESSGHGPEGQRREPAPGDVAVF